MITKEFIRERNRLYRLANEADIEEFCKQHNITIPRGLLWVYVYTSITIILHPVRHLPDDPPDNGQQGYSWSSMLYRANFWLKVHGYTPLPHLNSYQQCGRTFSPPKEFYVQTVSKTVPD